MRGPELAFCIWLAGLYVSLFPSELQQYHSRERKDDSVGNRNLELNKSNVTTGGQPWAVGHLIACLLLCCNTEKTCSSIPGPTIYTSAEKPHVSPLQL